MFDIKQQVNRTSCGTEGNCYLRFQFVTRGVWKRLQIYLKRSHKMIWGLEGLYRSVYVFQCRFLWSG